MKKQFTFSKALLDKIKPEREVFEVSDPSRPGMRCRIRPNGSKSVYVTKAVNGKRIKYTIGLVSGLGGKNIEQLYRNALLFIDNGLTAREAKAHLKTEYANNNAFQESLAMLLPIHRPIGRKVINPLVRTP